MTSGDLDLRTKNINPRSGQLKACPLTDQTDNNSSTTHCSKGFHRYNQNTDLLHMLSAAHEHHIRIILHDREHTHRLSEQNP